MTVKWGVYVPLGLEGYELCHPVKQDDFERINVEINGTPRNPDWKPIPVRLVREDQGLELLSSDSPWLGSCALIFRARAVEALDTLLRQYGELLPLACSEADVLIYNPIRVIDALDEKASSVLRFSDGRIMMIKRHLFRYDIVQDVDVFKIPNLRVSPTFVSQRFIEAWEASGLKGLEFKEVWAPN
jgi:hypothetical protein